MALTAVNIVAADDKRIFRKSLCSFLVDRLFSYKIKSFSLFNWLIIFCLSTSVIAGGDFFPNIPNKAENAPVYSLKDDTWIVNVPTVITLAPGLFFIPEVGYCYMDNVIGKDQGTSGIVGSKVTFPFFGAAGRPEHNRTHGQPLPHKKGLLSLGMLTRHSVVRWMRGFELQIIEHL
jgi:hypothetical protein